MTIALYAYILVCFLVPLAPKHRHCFKIRIQAFKIRIQAFKTILGGGGGGGGEIFNMYTFGVRLTATGLHESLLNSRAPIKRE